jgi:hypothetical protein
MDKYKVKAVRSKRYSYNYLIKQYNIKKPHWSNWTKEARLKHREQQKKFKIEDKKFEKSIKHLSLMKNL